VTTSHDRTFAGAHPDTADHWPEIAEHWRHIGPPLRPVAQDIRFCLDAVQDWIRRRGVPRVLLLGVTPELYRLPWPKGTDFLAIDRSQAMIDTAWPGPKDAVQCTDWLTVALPDASRDLAFCDGGLHLLPYPEQQQRLAGLLSDVLSDQGLCILRLYVPPPQREPPQAVLDDLLEGSIPNLNFLKPRLAMSLMDDAAQGVELGEVWQALHNVAPDLTALASKIGWPPESMLAIQAYRGSRVRYYFVTVDQVRDMFCRSPGGFEVRRLCVPSYESGEQYPTIVLQRCPREARGREQASMRP